MSQALESQYISEFLRRFGSGHIFGVGSFERWQCIPYSSMDTVGIPNNWPVQPRWPVLMHLAEMSLWFKPFPLFSTDIYLSFRALMYSGNIPDVFR